MRISLLILAVFVIIFTLGKIDYPLESGFPPAVSGSNSLLPRELNFIMISFFIVIAAILVAFRIMGKRFNEKEKISRVGKRPVNQLVIAAFFVTLVFIQLGASAFLHIHIFNLSYYLIALGGISVFEFVITHRISQTSPDWYAISNDTIISKTLFGPRKRKLENLKTISYHPKYNYVILGFKDGLENIELYFSDYDLKEIEIFVGNLQKIMGERLQTDENYDRFFHKTNWK